MISFVLTLKRLLLAVIHLGKDPLVRTAMLTLTFILFSGTLFYHQIEEWSLFDSFYFSFISLVPTGIDTGLILKETISKWFTLIYLMVGVGVMLILLILFGLTIAKVKRTEEEKCSRSG